MKESNDLSLKKFEAISYIHSMISFRNAFLLTLNDLGFAPVMRWHRIILNSYELYFDCFACRAHYREKRYIPFNSDMKTFENIEASLMKDSMMRCDHVGHIVDITVDSRFSNVLALNNMQLLGGN